MNAKKPAPPAAFVKPPAGARRGAVGAKSGVMFGWSAAEAQDMRAVVDGDGTIWVKLNGQWGYLLRTGVDGFRPTLPEPYTFFRLDENAVEFLMRSVL